MSNEKLLTDKNDTIKFLQKLGGTMRFVRRSKGITVKQISQIAKCEERYISYLENARILNPNPKILFTIIRYLDLIFYMNEE